MNWRDQTTIQLAQQGNNVGNREVDEVINAFLREAPSKEIASFLEKLSRYHANNQWIDRATFALQSKQMEENNNKMIEQMNMLNQQTEKLTIQNETQIKNSVTLSNQTDVLITESKNLATYTKGLLVLTAALLFSTVALLWLDWHKHN